MITLLLHLLRLFPFFFSGHRQLAVENLVLRQQLAVYKRTTARPKLRTADRLFWFWLAGVWAGWRAPLVIVTTDAVLRWQRRRFREYWAKLSARRTGSRLMPKRRPRPSQTWRTFLDNHVRGLVPVDFVTVPTARLRVLFVLVVLAHHRRRVVHFNVTEHSTAPGPPSRSWTPSRTTPRRQDAPERVGRGRVERWRARGSVRWLIHSFRRGPQSGSHSDVSSAPPNTTVSLNCVIK